MELNDKPYQPIYCPMMESEKAELTEESDSFYEFTVSYPKNRKNYYKIIFLALEKDGWMASNGRLIGNEICTTFKKKLYE